MDILIKNITDEIADALTQKAQASGKDRMTLIRELLINAASEPMRRERYAYKFYGPGEARGLVKRLSSHVNGIGGGSDRCSPVQIHAIKQAQDLMRRNEAGDQMNVYDLLKANFEEVIEVP